MLARAGGDICRKAGWREWPSRCRAFRNGTDKDGARKFFFLRMRCPTKKRRTRLSRSSTRRSGVCARWTRRSAGRNPSAPYTTSKLQQDASSRLGFNVRRTMGVAQKRLAMKAWRLATKLHDRSDYLYEDRFDTREPGCGDRGSRVYCEARAEVSAGEGGRVQGQEGRAGCA